MALASEFLIIYLLSQLIFKTPLRQGNSPVPTTHHRSLKLGAEVELTTIKLTGNPQQNNNCYKILLLSQAFGNVPSFSRSMTRFNKICGSQSDVQTSAGRATGKAALPAVVWDAALNLGAQR